MKNYTDKICKYGFFSITAILSVCVVFLCTYLTSNVNFLFGDDGTFSLYRTLNESIFDCLKFKNHGDGFIGLFLSKFFCFALPNRLHIHPSDFIGAYCGFVRGWFTVAILMTMACWGCFFKKSKTLFLFLLAILIAIFFSSAPKCMMLMCNYNFFRYFLPFLFIVLFWSFLLKNLLAKRKNTNWFELTVACFSGYVTGTSVEINIFANLMCVILLILFSFGVKIFVKNERLKKSLKLNLDKNFYIPVVFLIVSAVLFTTSQGFREIATESRGLGKTAVDFVMIKDFFQMFFEIYIVQNLFFFLSFLVLFAGSVFFAFRKNKIKKIIFPLFYTISVFFALFSLIFLGETYYFGSFWLKHTNIIFLYEFTMLFTALYCLGFVLNNLDKTIKKTTFKRMVTVVFAGILLFSALIAFKNGIIAAKNQNDYLYSYKKNMYISEKMFRFYCLKNETAILQKTMISTPRYELWTFNAVKKDEDFYKNSVITDSYYKRIYRDKADIGFILKDDAIKTFYKKGGVFTSEELENVNFSRLYDENFVLNNQYSPKEIQDIITI